MDATARLRFEGLERRFGPISVLTGVSGEIGPGEVLLVTGPNGCGKSTLLRCLAGLLAPESGWIELATAGAAPSRDPATRRARCGFLSPDVAFYDDLTVDENLVFFARLRRVDPEPARAFAAELRLPLARKVGVLSSGMRQRLRWVWSELAAPPVMLLDEPLQNLDAAAVDAVSHRLARRVDAGALAVVANPSPLALEPLARKPRELRLAG